MKRLFSRDPLTGVTKYFTYNESSSGRESEDTFTIETQTDVEPLLAANGELYKEYTSLDRWGEGRRVASIPMPIYQKLRERGITRDPKAFKAWLNDPDNRAFRTSPGRV